VLDETVTSQSEADLGPQPNGAYFARVTAIDGNGLEGRPAVQGFRATASACACGPKPTGPDHGGAFRAAYPLPLAGR
jgi:hypothetical protein